MVFQIVSVVVPVLVFFITPHIITHFKGNPEKYKPWLIGACVLFFISWYLPSPLIHGQDTSFTTHFLGGGVFTGMLWFYIKKSLKWQVSWQLEMFSLFALVSALGVMNELFELFLKEAGLSRIGLTDTNWDLLANTLGSFLFYVGYVVSKCYDRRN